MTAHCFSGKELYSEHMKNFNPFFLVKVLATFGAALAVYLLWQQFFRPVFQPCYVNSLINCDAIISGGVSQTFGLPTPLIGLIGYVVILFAAFKKMKRLLLGMAAFGLVFCLWIAYQELFLLKVICPVCILCQLDMGSVFVLGVILNRKK